MIYIVNTADKRIGKFTSLSSAKNACISNFRDTNWHYYTIQVYNPKLNKVSKTHYSFCSYFKFSGCNLAQIFLDYGKVEKHYIK